MNQHYLPFNDRKWGSCPLPVRAASVATYLQDEPETISFVEAAIERFSNAPNKDVRLKKNYQEVLLLERGVHTDAVYRERCHLWFWQMEAYLPQDDEGDDPAKVLITFNGTTYLASEDRSRQLSAMTN